MNFVKPVLIIGFLLSLAIFPTYVGPGTLKPEATGVHECGCARSKPHSYDAEWLDGETVVNRTLGELLAMHIVAMVAVRPST